MEEKVRRKKGRRKKTNRKGRQRQIVRISPTCTHTYSAKINKWIAGTLKLPTYLRPRSPHGERHTASTFTYYHTPPSLTHVTLTASSLVFSSNLIKCSTHSLQMGTVCSEYITMAVWLMSQLAHSRSFWRRVFPETQLTDT